MNLSDFSGELCQRRSGLRWRGAGCPFFVGDAGVEDSTPIRVDSRDEFLRQFVSSERQESDVLTFQRSVEGYFLCGGRSCYVLSIPGLNQLRGSELRELLLGEDGGPGCRTGLHCVADLDEVGTLAAPGVSSREVQDCLIAFAHERPTRALLLEPSVTGQPSLQTDDGSVSVALRDRMACLQDVFPLDDGTAIAPSGPVLGAIEARELDSETLCFRRPSFGERGRAGDPGGTLPDWFERLPVSAVTAGVALIGDRFGTLRSWREWEGIRRSIEFGTRWLLYDVYDPLTGGRVERELRDFLFALYDAGLLGGRRASEAFRVRCTALPRGDRWKLKLELRVRLRKLDPIEGGS